ncbi:carboxypeptidase regulatory-like domain-containing protein [Kineococcus terrestris]|uniref:carboxypeptidase regulatory-like domain-containing protein n=1 Tax=Kineococcus terrestris TaxID=2044856 RepID=UPI0034DB5976
MPQDRAPRDEGFSLLEVVVSMLVFAVLSAAIAGLLVKTMDTTGQGTRREVAVNLADSEKEFQVGRPWTAVASRTSTTTVDGTAYTVDTRVVTVPDTSGNSCNAASGTALNAKVVTVSVTWPGMRVEPVRTDTLRPIPMGESGGTKGAVAWQLKDAANKGLRGITATLTNSAGGALRTTTSDGNGCVVFSELDAGSYGVRVDQDGYVSPYNVQQLQQSAVVELGKITVVTPGVYSPHSSARLFANAPSSAYPLPEGVLGFHLAPVDGLGAAQQRRGCDPGQDAGSVPCVDATGLVSRLYPKNYNVYAGLCTDPLVTGTAVQPRTTTPVPETALNLGATAFRVTSLNPAPLTVSAVHATNSTCTGQEVVLSQSITPSATAVRRFALPYGTWTLTARRGGPTGTVVGQTVVTITSTAVTDVLAATVAAS